MLVCMRGGKSWFGNVEAEQLFEMSYLLCISLPSYCSASSLIRILAFLLETIDAIIVE